MILMNYETDKKPRVSALRKQIAACLPDTSQDCAFQEAFARHPASAIAFAIGKLEGKTGSHLLWVQEERAIKQQGRPFIHGLPPSLRHSIIHVTAASAKDALWAMEEGLRCPSLLGVIGEITGDPAALDFTASRRLAVACERHGVPAFLIRFNGTPNLSGARERWRVHSAPSYQNHWNSKAAGTAVLSAQLFRSRSVAPGAWDFSYDGKANRLDLVPDAGNGALDENTAAAG